MFENGISVVSLTQKLQQDQQRVRHGIAFLLTLQMLSHSQQRSKVLSQLLPEKLVRGTFNCTPLLTAKLLWQNCCLVFILFCISLQLSSRVSNPNSSHKIVSGPRAHNSVYFHIAYYHSILQHMQQSTCGLRRVLEREKKGKVRKRNPKKRKRKKRGEHFENRNFGG